ncbi:hypothetical protein [Azohydromonas lata]|uniref:Uncharacterized protein n=1 Tax=Azohydromonas lata TaxID=45677 RepID=A0ABU5IHH2_9BURK|nr:hypothetical protein [Azohydromonas lata]MDZ5458055.1 hypothetical protein [Azohydromonas lata]
MDRSDPMFWIIGGLALLIAFLLLRGPWDGGAWGGEADRTRRRDPPDED